MARDSGKDLERQKAGDMPSPSKSSRADIDAFLDKARALSAARPADARHGRLVFALDATMSRQPTWDIACSLQADMFREAAAIGTLDIQLVYFRGFGECRASRWVSDGRTLAALMEKIDCRGGHTQIGKVLSHTRQENERERVQALVYVGDAMEESLDALCAAAGELGLLGIPAFVFQEGNDPVAAQAFQEIARLSGGAYCRFTPGSAKELADLLRAVAAYAAGGRKAMQALLQSSGGAAAALLAQMK
jgi:hypothetical protein